MPRKPVHPLKAAAAKIKAAIDHDYAADPTPELADLAALAQELRYNLSTLETAITAILGKREGAIQGNLSDGRAFTLKRAQDRVAWDHDEWKRDARRVITQTTAARFRAFGEDETFTDPELFDTSTGEAVTLARVIQEALAMAQEVHGSTAPRSTALKRLGLYASDYCASSPAGWRFNAIRPEDPATTTDKD
jgi:hypothetical protein